MAQIIKEQHRWMVSGDMTIAHVESLLAESKEMTSADKNMEKSLEIDLGEVTDVDTATISLLFEWLREAHSHKCKIKFSNFPQNLVSLATLYGVVELLPQTSH
ncbi:MAG: STAS domain-containing protein [Pseudomonadota bacterium]